MRLVAWILILALNAGTAGAFDPFRQAGIDQRPGASVPFDTVYQDEAGSPVTIRGLAHGRPVLLAPVLHDCPNICGVTLAGLVQAVRAQSFVPGQDFAIIAFGIDRRESTRQAAASLQRLREAFPGLSTDSIHALTGTAADIKSATDALGYRYAWDERIGQYAHVAATAVLTPDGRVARWLYGLAPEPTDLKLALTEAGEGRIGGWADQLLLLCYRYDPTTGQYSSLVWILLRVGGGLTVAGGAGFIALMIIRERRDTAREGL